MQLPHKIRKTMFFFWRQAIGLFPQGNALHEEGHILRQRPHALEAFGIGCSFTSRPAVDAVPILPRRDGHAADGKKLVQFIKCCRQAAPTGRDDGGADFHGLIKGRTEEQPRQKGDKIGIGRREINGTAHDEAVTGGKLRRHVVDEVSKDALANFCALPTGNTAAYGLRAEGNHFRVHAFSRKYLLHFSQCQSRIPMNMGRTVNQ